MRVLQGRRQSSVLAHLENKLLAIRPKGGKEDVLTLSATDFSETFLL